MNDLTWLEKNKAFLNIKRIEEEAQMPDKTIDHVLAGRRNFPKKWEKPLKVVIDKIKNPA
jgi:uncharacterized protein YlzI (FlbEa/FlbD family)